MSVIKQQTQRLFNTALNALRNQGHASVLEDGTCVYKGANGDRCAAGFFVNFEDLEDEWIQDNLEEASVDHMFTALIEKGLRHRIDREALQNMGFVQSLQHAHDNAAKHGTGFLRAYEIAMKDLALQEDLNYVRPLDRSWW